MNKREKVIKGLECCNPNEYQCGVCPYDDGYETCARCKPTLHSNAIALLKVQEAIEPSTYHHLFICPVCKNTLFEGQKFCHECGQAVKWE